MDVCREREALASGSDAVGTGGGGGVWRGGRVAGGSARRLPGARSGAGRVLLRDASLIRGRTTRGAYKDSMLGI